MLCGRYEGFDDRIRQVLKPREISVGDFVCNGGEVPAMVVIDAVIRLVPGVLGDAASAADESHSEDGRIEYANRAACALMRAGSAEYEAHMLALHDVGSNNPDGVEIKATMQAAAKDPKTGLQEWLQARKMRLPAYRVVETQGAAHQQTFDVECEIAELGLSERGIGGSRRAGEQAAAAAVLEILKTRNPR